jgi:hypothetical protein
MNRLLGHLILKTSSLGHLMVFTAFIFPAITPVDPHAESLHPAALIRIQALAQVVGNSCSGVICQP